MKSMKKKLLSLALALALCLGLAVPALATGPDTFEDGSISVTNVTEHKKVDSVMGTFFVKEELTCVAPASIAPIKADSEYTYSVQVYRLPEGRGLKDVQFAELEEYLPEGDTAELTGPGVYYVYINARTSGGGGFTAYLITVQEGEDTPAAPKFTDVPVDAYCADAVAWAVEQGITNGFSATTFSPNDTCTRAQIITFLWRAAGSPEPKNVSAFADVKTDAYYAKATAWAKENGMAGGDAFSPNAPCTRKMAVEFMWKHAGSPDAAAASFSDVSSPAVNWAVEKGVTNGSSATTFSPDNTCTRGQIVTFLYRGFQSALESDPQADQGTAVDWTEIFGSYISYKDRWELVMEPGPSWNRIQVGFKIYLHSTGGLYAEGTLLLSEEDGVLTGGASDWDTGKHIEIEFYQDHLIVDIPNDNSSIEGRYEKVD